MLNAYAARIHRQLPRSMTPSTVMWPLETWNLPAMWKLLRPIRKLEQKLTRKPKNTMPDVNAKMNVNDDPNCMKPPVVNPPEAAMQEETPLDVDQSDETPRADVPLPPELSREEKPEVRPRENTPQENTHEEREAPDEQ